MRTYRDRDSIIFLWYLNHAEKIKKILGNTGCPKLNFPNLKSSKDEINFQKLMKFRVGHNEGMGICLSE